MRFEIFKGNDFLYYFRFVAANGEVIATSGDGYTTKSNCEYALNLVKRHAAFSPVYFK